VYLPDGTTATPSVTITGTGVYRVDYTPTVAGLHTLRWLATGTNAGSDGGWVVGATEGGEHLGHHRLHSEGDPGDTAGDVGLEHRKINCVGIAFDRDLSIVREWHCREDSDEIGGWQQRRRSPTEEH
jgi:hypothetical protein